MLLLLFFLPPILNNGKKKKKAHWQSNLDFLLIAFLQASRKQPHLANHLSENSTEQYFATQMVPQIPREIKECRIRS